MSGDPIVEILKEQLASRQARNSSYSLRSYARDLEMDPSNLSKIIKYQKNMGRKLRQEIARKLGCSLVDGELEFSENIGDNTYESHELDVFQIVSAWHYYAILELSKLKNIKLTAESVSGHLGISSEMAEKSLKRLIKLGLMSLDSSGNLRCTSESSSSILNITTSKAHRNHQREILEKAIEALEDIPVEERSQSSMTIAVNSKRLEEAKQIISRFRRRLGRFLSQGDDLDSVYHLSVSLYPVTNSKKGKKT